ncbi:MAG TPA: ferritin-like domain-containing protein [Polyangiaceae bacterium]|jgi:hypothetical protein|nr:ferritin-like domain-containing protein [Polyangiaceae bacterium]
MTSVADRPTSWWRHTLERRAERRTDDAIDLSVPFVFDDDAHRRAALKFFNAAYRAEESGFNQAHALAKLLSSSDPELAEALALYGNEEGWHRELLTGFLEYLGGTVQPMGKTTGFLFRLYARAERMDTILLTNLMFETIGSTTYRIALGRLEHPAVKSMLTVLTSDEAFHVPLNVHFLKRALADASALDRVRLRALFHVVFVALVALPLASRPKSGVFDRIGTLELSRAYARELGKVFAEEPGLPFEPPRWLLRALGVVLDAGERRSGNGATSVDAAERAADRATVTVTTLP